mmetsp:Transcript_12251/g.29603  ORF Transcript_12251/g.29603 Transcript_12251/m.29603 type:complete len:385 (-) Transcript_12251:58-1212(-)
MSLLSRTDCFTLEPPDSLATSAIMRLRMAMKIPRLACGMSVEGKCRPLKVSTAYSLMDSASTSPCWSRWNWYSMTRSYCNRWRSSLTTSWNCSCTGALLVSWRLVTAFLTSAWERRAPSSSISDPVALSMGSRSSTTPSSVVCAMTYILTPGRRVRVRMMGACAARSPAEKMARRVCSDCAVKGDVLSVNRLVSSRSAGGSPRCSTQLSLTAMMVPGSAPVRGVESNMLTNITTPKPCTCPGRITRSAYALRASGVAGRPWLTGALAPESFISKLPVLYPYLSARAVESSLSLPVSLAVARNCSLSTASTSACLSRDLTSARDAMERTLLRSAITAYYCTAGQSLDRFFGREVLGSCSKTSARGRPSLRKSTAPSNCAPQCKRQ